MGSERVEARVQLEPLLLKQELVMDTVTLHGLSVNLERDKAGKTYKGDLASGGFGASSSSAGRSSREGGSNARYWGESIFKMPNLESGVLRMAPSVVHRLTKRKMPSINAKAY